MEERELVDLLPLQKSENELKNSLIKEDNVDKVKQLISAFNVNIAKKNILRISKYNELVDLVNNQIGERLSKCPGEMSNKDLIDYLNALNKSIDQSNKSVEMISDTPAIQINQVNINADKPELSRESREKIMEAVKAIFDKSKQLEQDNIEEAQLVDSNENIIIEEERIEIPEITPEFNIIKGETDANN